MLIENVISDSKEFQPGGKDRQLLCYECRAHFKKTNELPPITSSNTGNSITGELYFSLTINIIQFEITIFKMIIHLCFSLRNR